MVLVEPRQCATLDRLAGIYQAMRGAVRRLRLQLLLPREPRHHVPRLSLFGLN